MNRISVAFVVAGLLAAGPAPGATRLTLNVPEVIQEQDQWCWAASSAAVLKYYNQAKSQCTIANYTRTTATWHDFGSTDCCTNPSGACNYWNYNWGYSGSIQDILQHWNVPNTPVGSAYTIPQIQTEIGAGKPFIIHWGLSPSGGHFVVGYGISDSTIQYMDPWMGEGYKLAKYSWVVKGADHTWDLTNKMTNAPTSGTVERAGRLPAGLVARATPGGLTVAFDLPDASPVDLRILTLDGRVERSLHLESVPPGARSATIPGALPRGSHVVTVQSEGFRAGTVLFVGD